MDRKTLAEVRNRVNAMLNRPVLTESDKKTVGELKNQVLKEWNTRIITDSNRRAFSLAEARVVTKLNGRMFGDSGKTLHDVGSLALSELSRRLSEAASGRRFTSLKQKIIPRYDAFKSWLQTPVTVRATLGLLGVWGLTVVSTQLQVFWGYFGYVSYISGYVALIATALTTWRLTVNSQKLWLQHSQAGREANRKIIETEPSRRGIVLREIEFLTTDFLLGPKQLSLKKDAFLMRRKDWQSLQDALYDTFLKGAPPLLYELGHRLGTSVGRDLRRISQKPGVILSQLEEVSRELGWGTISAHGNLVHGTNLTFKVQQSPFCVDDSPLVKNTQSCHLVVGLVTGICEEVYGWPYSSHERKCVRSGDDYCEVVAAQSTVPTKQKKGWNLSVIFPTLHPWVQS